MGYCVEIRKNTSQILNNINIVFKMFSCFESIFNNNKLGIDFLDLNGYNRCAV